jgi:hypothetical protein
MATTIKTRLIRALVGMLIGAAITGLLTALLFFAFIFLVMSQPANDVTWAVLAGVAGGAYGYVAGLILGLFLGFMQRGPAFGAVCGDVFGVVINGAIILFGNTSTWQTREVMLCAAVIAVTMLSGFSVSIVLSAMASATRRTHDNHELLNLEQVLSRLEQHTAK